MPFRQSQGAATTRRKAGAIHHSKLGVRRLAGSERRPVDVRYFQTHPSVSKKIPEFFRKFTIELVHQSLFRPQRVVNKTIDAIHNHAVIVDESRLLAVSADVAFR